jgi:hypothetical protein
MVKFKLVLILLLFSISIFAQDFNHSGFVYSLDNVGIQGVKATLYTKRTSTYEISSPQYVPESFNTGTVIPSSDDVTHGPFNIGFSFTFFGTAYTQFYVGSNGWIGFSANQTTGYVAQFIPNAGSPKNAILADWEDLLPGSANIYYRTIGTAPNRKLIVSFNAVPHYGCRSNLHTFQFILYETSNVIDINTASKPLCGSTSATQGLINLAGTTVVPVGGRNASTWSVAVGETKRFTPSTPDVNWISTATVYTNSVGRYIFSNLGLDINSYVFKIDLIAPISVSTAFSTSDAADMADVIIGRTNTQSRHYFMYDVNKDGTISASDLYACYAKRNNISSSWNGVQCRLFTLTEINTIKGSTANLISSLPGTQVITLETPANNGSSNFYMITSGYFNQTGLQFLY